MEYIVVDGGSTDQSLKIIEKYEDSITWWVSEPDEEQSSALNKGFCKSTGEIMAYLNADDMYCPWVLRTVASIFSQFSEIDWLTSLRPMLWDQSGQPVQEYALPGFTRSAFYLGQTLGDSDNHIGWIQQESTFWRRSLWEKAGGYISEDLNMALDFELWARFYQYAQLVGIVVPLAGFRLHREQKSSEIEKYYAEAKAVLADYKDSYSKTEIEKPINNRYWTLRYDTKEFKWWLIETEESQSITTTKNVQKKSEGQPANQVHNSLRSRLLALGHRPLNWIVRKLKT